MIFYLKLKAKMFHKYCLYKSTANVLCKYHEEWTCPFFISCLVLIAVKTGNDVSTFGGSASIVSGMRPV